MADLLPPVVATLLADTKEFTAKLGEAREEMTATTSRGESLFSSLASVGKIAFFALGSAAIAVGAESVKMASQFQNSTAQIASAAGISEGAANKIGDAFLATSGKTESSANEMAAAYATVAGQLGSVQGKALSAAQAQQVMLDASDLADAKLGDLDTTTTALAQTMQAFQLKASDAGQASDILYSTATLTNSGISQLAQGMARLHMRLGDASPSLKDTAGLLAVLAQNGVSGTRGLNTIASAFPKLLGGSKAVNEELQHIRVSVYDADGRFRGMNSTIAQLHERFATMTQAQQELAASTLFGSSAASTMIKIIQAGPAAYEAQAKAADRVGAAHRAAVAQMQTLDGELHTLGAEMENYGVRIGRVLIPKIELLMKDSAAVVQWFAKNKVAAIALGAVVGGVLSIAITAFAVQTLGKLINNAKSAYQAVQQLLGLKGSPDVSGPTLTSDSQTAGDTIQQAVASAGQRLIADAQAAAAALEAGGTATGTAVEAGADAAENSIEAGGVGARTDLESGGDSAAADLESGADTSRTALETGGDSASGSVESGADTARTTLESGGETAGGDLESGADTGRDALETGGDTGRDALETGGDTAAASMESAADASRTAMETGGDAAGTAVEAGAVTAGSRLDVAGVAFGAIVVSQLSDYINSKLSNNKSVKTAQANIPGWLKTIEGIPVVGTTAKAATDLGAAASGLTKNTTLKDILGPLSGGLLGGVGAAAASAGSSSGTSTLAKDASLKALQSTVAKQDAALKAKASGADVAKLGASVTSSLKPKASSADVKQVTSTVKSVQKAVESQSSVTNVTVPISVTLDGKQIADQISKLQIKKSKATGNVHGKLAGSTQTGTGIAR